ncbi:hypothetical protein ACQJBY_009641 [Aegilops geniculata]
MAERPRWQERQQLARLCDLVADSLLPHLESEPLATRRPQLTREEERRILVALSRVNKAIRGWDDDEVDDGEQGCASDQIVSCSEEAHSCCLPPDHHFDDGFSCLANIISIVVGLLHLCSDYIKHSAGNILMAISNYLMKKPFGFSLLSWSGQLYTRYQHALITILQLMPPKILLVVHLLRKA